MWPIRASFLLDPVPAYPTDSDFQCASMSAASHDTDPAYVWRLAAVRWRLGHMGAPLDLVEAIEADTVSLLALFARRAA